MIVVILLSILKIALQLVNPLTLSLQVIDVYEPPEHLVLHHNHVAENLAGTLVGVITLKDPQLSPLSIEILTDPGSAFEVRVTLYLLK